MALTTELCHGGQPQGGIFRVAHRDLKRRQRAYRNGESIHRGIDNGARLNPKLSEVLAVAGYTCQRLAAITRGRLSLSSDLKAMASVACKAQSLLSGRAGVRQSSRSAYAHTSLHHPPR